MAVLNGLAQTFYDLMGTISSVLHSSALRDWVTVVALLFLLPAILKLLNRLFSVMEKRLTESEKPFLKSLRYKEHEFVSAQQFDVVLSRCIYAVRLTVFFITVYLYVSMVFSLLPETKGLAHSSLTLMKTVAYSLVQAVAGYMPNFFSIIIITGISFYALRLIKSFFGAISSGRLYIRGFYKEWADPTFKIMRFFIVMFVLVMVFPLLPGFNSPAFKGISVFLGVLLSLGSTSAVANIVAGIVLIYMRSFEVGDRIETNGVVGDVVEKTMLITRVRTIHNEEITIPNGIVLGTPTMNYTKQAETNGLILHTAVTIGYEEPWRQVHELLIAAAKATEDVLAEPEPFVLQKSLGDFAVCYELKAYTHAPAKMAMTYSALHENIQDQFNQAGIEIMSPHYTALRDGNTITVPEPNRPQGYKPSVFNLPGFTST